MMTRLGIWGGSFDPPHFGHLRPALEAMERLKLEAVFFMPSGAHPFKGTGRLAPVVHRLAMTRLAIAGQSGFELCDLDATRTETCYTIDTLRELERRFPLGELILLLGSDLLAEIHLWKAWQQLLEVAHICPLVRPGYDVTTMDAPAVHYFADWRVQPEDLDRQRLGRFGFGPLSVTPVDISSTDLRRRVRGGESIRYLTPEAVVAYIQQNGLYK